MLKRRGIKHEVLNAKYHAQEAEIVAQAGKPGHGHHRHQHGRPRHRHPARRQPRVHGAVSSACAEESPRSSSRRRESASSTTTSSSTTSHGGRELPRAAWPRLGAHLRRTLKAQRDRARAGRRQRRPAHHRHRTPRVPPHRQPAARPRRPPGRSGLLALLPVARRRPDAHLRVRPHLRPDAAPRHGRGRADRTRHGQPRHRARPEAGRSAELRRSESTCSSTTT